MALNTKAFAAQDALLSALSTHVGLADWQLDYGLPAGRPTELHLWVDESVDDWTQDVPTTGLVSKQEEFRLAVYLYGRRTDATAAEVRDEISSAAGAVAEVIGAAPFLGGVVLFAYIAAAQYEGAFADADGRQREGVLKLIIACHAFLEGA